MTLWIHEWKQSRKSLLVWMICIGGLCFGCMLLYHSLEDSLEGMADAYSNMGAMSAALGMDRISIATLTGFFATEIALMHSLGGAMYAAVTGGGTLSGEEAGHTGEFLYALPVSRDYVIGWKYLSLLMNLILLDLVCAGLYALGFFLMGEELPGREFLLYMLASLLAQAEIGTVCFCVSACSRRSQTGVGLGIVLLLYAADLMGRIIPAVEKVKYITPFYYSNGADIFAEGRVETAPLLVGIILMGAALAAGWLWYRRKDLAA